MNDNASQKYRLESMQQELNQFSRAANDILSRQYLNADTLRKLNIEVPPNKTAFGASSYYSPSSFLRDTDFLFLVLWPLLNAIFKIASEQSRQNEFLSNYFLTLLLVKGDSGDQKIPC